MMKARVQVHLHRESSMDFMLKEADIVMVCSPNMTLRQVTKVLQQRHACLQGRTLFFRISNTLKVLALLLKADPYFALKTALFCLCQVRGVHVHLSWTFGIQDYVQVTNQGEVLQQMTPHIAADNRIVE